MPISLSLHWYLDIADILFTENIRIKRAGKEAAQDAAAAPVPVRAAALPSIRKRNKQPNENSRMKTARLFRKEGRKMGDTNSMLYAIGAFILIYLIAMGIYQLVLWIRKKRKNR